MDREQERPGERARLAAPPAEVAEQREHCPGGEAVERDVGQVVGPRRGTGERGNAGPERVRERRVQVEVGPRPQGHQRGRGRMRDQRVVRDEGAVVPEEEAVRHGATEGGDARGDEERRAAPERGQAHVSGADRSREEQNQKFAPIAHTTNPQLQYMVDACWPMWARSALPGCDCS